MYIIFIIEQIQQKLMTTFFNKFRKPCFGPILVHFPNFSGKTTFSGKSYSVKHMVQFQENTRTDEITEGRKDGQILFQRTLPAAAVGQRAFNMK